MVVQEALFWFQLPFKSKNFQVSSARQQYRLFLTLLPFTRTTTNIYSKTRHHSENPRTQDEAEAPPVPLRPGRLHQKGKEQPHTDCIARPPGQCSTTQRGLLLTPSSSSRQRAPQSNDQPPPALCITFESPYSVLAPQRLQGILWGPATRHLTITGERSLQQPALGSWPTEFIPAGPKE